MTTSALTTEDSPRDAASSSTQTRPPCSATIGSARLWSGCNARNIRLRAPHGRSGAARQCNVTITLDVYSHVAEGLQGDAASRVARLSSACWRFVSNKGQARAMKARR